MLKDLLQTEQIHTDAEASIKGIGLQKVRAVERLLLALQEGKKAVFCTIEHIDDVLEVDISGNKPKYITEQDKSYDTAFSMNSHEVKNSLRIFFDNWVGTVESSESIQFIFYTNTAIAKEKKVGVLKEIDAELPDKPLIELLIERNYIKALPFVLPILKEYYLEQHSKHTNDIETYKNLWESMTDESWIKFFDLIEWNFGERDEKEVRSNINNRVHEMCVLFNVEEKFADKIVAQLIDMIESRTYEKDFLCKVVHVSEVKSLFLELAQYAKVLEKLDPMHNKWDEIKNDDIRNIGEKIADVCPTYDLDLVEELEQEYIDGSYEQKSYYEEKEVKAYNYRIYVVCKKIVKKYIKANNSFAQHEINSIFDKLTDEAEQLILDKSKTYKMPFKDRDMVRKTVILLFQECYLAFNEGCVVNE